MIDLQAPLDAILQECSSKTPPTQTLLKSSLARDFRLRIHHNVQGFGKAEATTRRGPETTGEDFEAPQRRRQSPPKGAQGREGAEPTNRTRQQPGRDEQETREKSQAREVFRRVAESQDVPPDVMRWMSADR